MLPLIPITEAVASMARREAEHLEYLERIAWQFNLTTEQVTWLEANIPSWYSLFGAPLPRVGNGTN